MDATVTNFLALKSGATVKLVAAAAPKLVIPKLVAAVATVAAVAPEPVVPKFVIPKLVGGTSDVGDASLPVRSTSPPVKLGARRLSQAASRLDAADNWVDN